MRPAILVLLCWLDFHVGWVREMKASGVDGFADAACCGDGEVADGSALEIKNVKWQRVGGPLQVRCECE
jgi:hypothetical protein